MAISLDSISKGKQLRAPRMILLGSEKVGKSTLASQAPGPIFLPIKGEEGIDGIEVDQFPTLRTLPEVMEALESLYNESHEYQTVVIDSASTLEPLVWDEACRLNGDVDSIEKIGGGFGKGYTEALKQWRKIMDALDYLRADRNLASILIGHVTVTTINDPETDSYDSYEWDIHKRARAPLYRWADSILFAHRRKPYLREEDQGFNKTRSRAVGDDERILLTQRRPNHPGGGRNVYGQLPYELPLSWQSLQDAIASAVAAGGYGDAEPDESAKGGADVAAPDPADSIPF